MRKAILLAVLIGVLTLPAWAQYQVGDPVADFTLPNAQGVDVSLSDYPDRIMFLAFWQPG